MIKVATSERRHDAETRLRRPSLTRPPAEAMQDPHAVVTNSGSAPQARAAAAASATAAAIRPKTALHVRRPGEGEEEGGRRGGREEHRELNDMKRRVSTPRDALLSESRVKRQKPTAVEDTKHLPAPTRTVAKAWVKPTTQDRPCT